MILIPVETKRGVVKKKKRGNHMTRMPPHHFNVDHPLLSNESPDPEMGWMDNSANITCQLPDTSHAPTGAITR